MIQHNGDMAEIDGQGPGNYLLCLREYLWREFGIRRDLVVPEARLVDDLGLTSIDMLNLSLEMEEGLDVGLLFSKKADALRTVHDVLQMFAEENVPLSAVSAMTEKAHD
jgi:acyl carrier protein